MAVLIPASAQNGQVTVEGFVVEAEILSSGVAESSGVLLIDEGRCYYIASNANDIKATIEKAVAAIQKIETVLTGVDAASNSPGGQTANIAQVTAARQQLSALKDQLA